MSDNDIIVTRMARIVGPEGNSTARIAIVADAPDTVSMAKGRPFMGAAGDLLTDCLIAAGLSRKDTYITYVVKEQPEGNNINAFLDLSKKYPVESPAYQEYVAALVKEFNHNRSNVIVACGPVALYALTGKKGLTNWRGSIIESTLLPGRKVIPILEPASALKQYVWKHLIIFDLQKVAKEMDSPAMPVDNRKYILGPTFAECVNFLEVCAHSELVAFDIEVSGTEVSCISFAYDAETAISIPFVASGKDYFSPEQETTIWELIAQVLENEQVQKVGQNVTFDTTFIFNKYGIAPCNLHDTMVACAILFPDFPKGLAFITSIYTNVPYYKDEGHAQITGKVASHDKSFWLYNAKDSIVLMEAFPRMLDDLIKSHNIITYARQVGLVLPLVFMSSYGIAMDVEGLRKESEIAVARLAELQTELDTLTSARGVPTVNINSPLQVKRYFYEKCRIYLLLNTR